ncbi:MAG TPA: biotin/lipoyl-containing protein [Candidatus Limnocylindrales bacterium]|nr:biotin/lipoyl-containing protein [Candidatus Limnocylindrales bacterium]
MTEQALPEPAALAPEAPGEPANHSTADSATLAPQHDGTDGLGPGDASLLGLIDRLSALLDRTELSELEVQVGSTGLVLRKPSALAPMVASAAVGSAAGSAPGEGSTAPSAGTTTAGATGPAARPAVMAPLSGIWYGAPAPGSAPYVTLGGEVAVGQVIGLIEAMKLFNEIKSDKAGRVVKINAEDGKLVRAKQPLIEVDPL